MSKPHPPYHPQLSLKLRSVSHQEISRLLPGVLSPAGGCRAGLCGVLESTEERFGGQGALRAEGAAQLVTGLWPWAGCYAPWLDRATAAARPLSPRQVAEPNKLLYNLEHWSPLTHVCRVRTQDRGAGDHKLTPVIRGFIPGESCCRMKAKEETERQAPGRPAVPACRPGMSTEVSCGS